MHEEDPARCVPVWPISRGADLEERLAAWIGEAAAAFAKASGFVGEEGQVLPIPNGLVEASSSSSSSSSHQPGIAGWLFGMGDGSSPFILGVLPSKLPGDATYAIPEDAARDLSKEHLLGWGLGSYAFRRYKDQGSTAAAAASSPSLSSPSTSSASPPPTNGSPKPPAAPPQLHIPNATDLADLDMLTRSIFIGRDLINTPCCDLGPADLAAACERVGRANGARVRIIADDRELARDFPLVHAVGRAAADGRGPRVVDMSWTPPEDAGSSQGGSGALPRVTLVGKGVCFDTGGLDIKPPSNMMTMKKDMGGAAAVLSLASMIMEARINVQLRVLVPAVENCVAGNAFRPSDVITSRSGLTVEIGNTDAEGRLILADCLSLASEDTPDVLLDMATLTGAHRVALGWDLPGIFTDSDAMASELYAEGIEHNDPVWRLPLWKPYDKLIDSKLADVNNIGSVNWGGAITAALFLQRFVTGCGSWVHIDFNGWTREKPGLPEGGEPQAVRAVFEVLRERYGTA